MAEKKIIEEEETTNATPTEQTSTSEVAREDTAPARARHQFSIWSLFWGVILVAIGALLLMNNLGILSVDWTNVWRLWPMLVVVAGFSILASTHWVWRTLRIIFIIATLGAIVWLTTGNNLPEGEVRNQQVTVQPTSSVKQARVELDAGASTLNITSHASGSIVDATLESSSQTLNKQETRSGDTQVIHIASTTGRSWWNYASGKNTWTVSLTEAMPLALYIQAGASHTTADLSATQLRSLELNAGASSLDIKLGAKQHKQVVSIDAGASTITLRLPKESGVSLTINGGLNTKNVADLQSINENTYRSDNYDNATHTIDITASAGAATFTIERY